MADSERDIIEDDGSSKAPLWLVTTGIVVILMAIFVGQNTEDIEFQFLTFTFTMPLWFVLVLVFVEPPRPIFAVAEPLSPDLRPTYLAIVLAIAFVIVMLIPPLRDFFNLYALSLRDWSIVLLGTLLWAVLSWIFWRYHFVDRFLGSGAEILDQD